MSKVKLVMEKVGKPWLAHSMALGMEIWQLTLEDPISIAEVVILTLTPQMDGMETVYKEEESAMEFPIVVTPQMS